jgi:hypothetical protein
MRRADRLGLVLAAGLVAGAPPLRAQEGTEAVHAEETSSPTVKTAPTSSDPYENALRLARALHDDRVVADLLSRRALGAAATRDDVAAVVDALEALAEPERAARFLEERAHRYPDERDTRVLLAELQTRMGRASDAVATWRTLAAGGGRLSTAEASAFADALAATGDGAGAYAVLKAAAPAAPDDAKDFWADLAALAWEADDAPEALLAYRLVWSRRYPLPGAAQRLMTLARNAGSIDEAIHVGLDDYRDSGDVTSLMRAAEIQEEQGAWPDLDRTLALALAHPEDVTRKPEYWLLRGETSAHLADHDGARKAYETALKLVPDSATAQSALLWDALDRADDAALGRYVGAWRAFADVNRELWAPFAVALARLGRAAEAIPFFVRHFREDSRDLLFTLEFADVLERVGNARLALKTRAFALTQLHREALGSLHRESMTADERVLVEETAQAIRARAGAEVGERWLRAVRAAMSGRADERPFFAEWYLDDDRVDAARRELDFAGRWADAARWRKYRLSVALADDDLATVRELLASSASVEPDERIEAEIALEQDRAAASSIVSVGDSSDPVADDWHQKLLDFRDRHRPYVRGGGSYLYINGLDVAGPELSAAHDAGNARLSYTADAERMVAPDRSLQLAAPVDEASVDAQVRLPSRRGVTEIGAGFDYQPAHTYQGATPVARARFFDQRLVTEAVGTTVQAAFDDPIEDTSLLRVAALQSRLQLGVRADFGLRWYASLDLHGREDHTRTFDPIGYEIGEEAEAGFKIVRRDPQWDVGVQAVADQRMNLALPGAIAGLVPRGADLGLYVPPTYQLLSVVTHLARGDFSQRYRPELTPFPRYDCEAAAGVLLPDLDAVVHVQCSASVLVSRSGYASAIAFYNRGVAGIADQTNAQLSVTYTQTF